MAELIPHQTPDEIAAITLPPVVVTLMAFHERLDSDADSQTAATDQPAAIGKILRAHGLDPQGEYPRRIAAGVQAISGPASGSKIMAQRALNDAILDTSTGLYKNKKVAKRAAKRGGPQNAQEFGNSIAALASFLHDYAEVELGPTIPLPSQKPEKARESSSQKTFWKWLGQQIATSLEDLGKSTAGFYPVQLEPVVDAGTQVALFRAELAGDGLIGNMLNAEPLDESDS